MINHLIKNKFDYIYGYTNVIRELSKYILQNGLSIHLNASDDRGIDIIRNHINKDVEFGPKESILCNWCYYWKECPAKSTNNDIL